jgi:hypothetical protein
VPAVKGRLLLRPRLQLVFDRFQMEDKINILFLPGHPASLM